MLWTFFICLVMTCTSTYSSETRRSKESFKNFYNLLGKELSFNLDELFINDLSEVHKSCYCSEIYDPVCASNGKSYYNQCRLDCDVRNEKTVKKVYDGKCIPF